MTRPILTGPPIPTLRRYGRSADADLIYSTLLMFKAMTSENLTRQLGMARPRVRAAVEELHVAGILTPEPVPGHRGGPAWRACPPQAAIAILRQAQRPRLGPGGPAEAARAHHATLAAALAERPAAIGDGIRHLPSRALTQRRLGEIAAVENREHLAMNPETEFYPAAVPKGLALAQTLRTRGIAPRTLGVIPADRDETTAEMARLAPDYRTLTLVPMKLFVIDRKIAFFPVNPTDYDQGYLEVTQPAVVTALADLFDKHWNTAPDPQKSAMPLIRLDAREQALLALLSAGHTDASAAAELRISPRSVTAILRGLMDRLGVDNRFQLGLALGALSATPLPPTMTHKENPDA